MAGVVCLCIVCCVSWGKLYSWITFERFKQEGFNKRDNMRGRFFLIQPLCPTPLLIYPNIWTILMKLCREVKNGEQSLNPDFEVVGVVLLSNLPARPKPSQMLTFPILVAALARPLATPGHNCGEQVKNSIGDPYSFQIFFF